MTSIGRLQSLSLRGVNAVRSVPRPYQECHVHVVCRESSTGDLAVKRYSITDFAKAQGFWRYLSKIEG